MNAKFLFGIEENWESDKRENVCMFRGITRQMRRTQRKRGGGMPM